MTANNTSTVDLIQWNNALVNKYVWNTVVFAILLVVGVVGNTSVIFIYKLKMTKKMEERFFIPVLAVLDLLACVSLCVFALQQSLAPVMISNTALCKSFNYLQYASSAASLFMLLAIALQRYRMVCDPFGRQMSKGLKYIAIAIAILFAYIIFVPNILLANTIHVQSNSTGLIGYRCTISIKNKTDKTLLFAFRIFVLSTFMFVIIAMSLLYSLVAKTIIQRMKTMKKRPLSTRSSIHHSQASPPVDGPAKNTKEKKGNVFSFDSLAREKVKKDIS